jgi:hypothetical protein
MEEDSSKPKLTKEKKKEKKKICYFVVILETYLDRSWMGRFWKRHHRGSWSLELHRE